MLLFKIKDQNLELLALQLYKELSKYIRYISFSINEASMPRNITADSIFWRICDVGKLKGGDKGGNLARIYCWPAAMWEKNAQRKGQECITKGENEGDRLRWRKKKKNEKGCVGTWRWASEGYGKEWTLALSCEEVLHEMANFTNTSSSSGKKVILLTLHEDYHHPVESLQSLFPHSANVKC